MVGVRALGRQLHDVPAPIEVEHPPAVRLRRRHAGNESGGRQRQDRSRRESHPFLISHRLDPFHKAVLR